MINIPLSHILKKIKESTNISDEEIDKKIKAKLDQLSGLISEEGAAHIVANELGVKLVETSGKLQINNILAGMRNVEVAGKITRKYEVRSFETEKRKGKLGSFMMADDSGFIRVVLWNDKADTLEKLNEGDIVLINGAYARENNNRKELHLSDTSVMDINPANIKINVETQTTQRKKIAELTQEDDNVELLATIVEVFSPTFFEVCPQCNKRIRQGDEGFLCAEHGKVEPSFRYVFNIYLDDGSDNVRCVLWRQQAQRLFDMTEEDILKLKDTPAPFDTKKNDLLGKIVKVVGRANFNENFNRVEFVPNLVFTNVNPEEEIAKMKASEGTETPKEEPAKVVEETVAPEATPEVKPEVPAPVEDTPATKVQTTQTTSETIVEAAQEPAPEKKPVEAEIEEIPDLDEELVSIEDLE